MTILETMVAMPAARALGWTLFYSLGEGAAAALVLAIALWLLRSARSRYAAACLAMVVILAAFAITFGAELAQERSAGSELHAIAVFQAVPEHGGGSEAAGFTLSAAAVLPWLAPIWTAGVLAFHLRCLAAWISLRRMCRTGVCPPPREWQSRLGTLREKLRISRPVALLESGLTMVPVAAGYLRPVILLPAGMLTGMPAGQIESILLHELAHIRRGDYFVNLLQTFVEGLLFYHPAVWWISHVIRTERENCCDDLVVAMHGDAREYVQALAALEFSRSAPAVATASTGGSLSRRIRRLVAPADRRPDLTPVLSAVLLAVTSAFALIAWQTQQAPPPQETPWQKWVSQDVLYIISDAERDAFLRLKTDEEREHFIGQFWERRNPTPGSPRNRFKEEYYRRIAFANQKFGSPKTPGWRTDRGHAYIVYGPPDEMESHREGGLYSRPAQEGGGTVTAYPFEAWRYKHIDGVGDQVTMEFVDRDRTGEYRMASNPADKLAPEGYAPPGKPEPPIPPHTANRAGAAVHVEGTGVQLSIPMERYHGHATYIYGRLLTSAQGVIGYFEDRPTGNIGPVYMKSTKLQPGSYRWFIAVRDQTTGTLYTDDIAFEVK